MPLQLADIRCVDNDKVKLSPYHHTCLFLFESVSQTLAVTEERSQHIVDVVEYTCAQHI